MPRLLSPDAAALYCELGSHRVTGQQTPPLQSQWQTTSSYSSHGNQHLVGMCQLASDAEDTAPPTIPCVALFPEPVPSVSSRAESIIGDYSWGLPTLPDCSFEEVAQINLRIHLAGRAIPSLPRTLASFSSPAVNDIFDAACALINAVDRFTLRKPTPVSEPSDGDRGQTANFGSPTRVLSLVIDTALDSSICLMLHACHQALLGVFEDLSASLLLCLAEPQKLTPPRTSRDESFFSTPYNQQPAAMANLISCLVSELDRAFLPLAGHSKSRPFRVHKAIPALTEKVGGYYEPAGLCTRTHATWQKDANQALLSEMEQRQMRVRTQVKAVERLLGWPNVL